MSADAIRSAILEAKDLPVEAVNVPEWGTTVYLRGMTGSERDGWEAEQYALSRGGVAGRDLQDFRARFLVRCLCDADGVLLFSASDAATLGKRSSAVLGRLYDLARRLSGLTKADEDTLLGNSEGAPSGASGSA